jgi:hypothetical protein
MDRRRDDGRIHAQRPRGLRSARRRTRHQLVIEDGESLGAPVARSPHPMHHGAVAWERTIGREQCDAFA